MGGASATLATLDDLQERIGELNRVDDADQLKERSADLDSQLEQALRRLQTGLTAS